MPFKRKIGNNVDFKNTSKFEKLIEDTEKNEINEQTIDLSSILKTKWKIFRVSPIHNFNKNNLKRYGKKLSQEMSISKKLVSKIAFHCTFSLNDKVRLNYTSHEAVNVEVTNDEFKSIYTAYFISWTEGKKDKEFLSLPILIVQSKDTEIPVIHSALCKMFDCDIQPVIFSINALITFFVNLLQSPRSNDISKELLFLEYKIPGEKTSNKLKLTLFLEDTIIVLAMIIDDLSEKFEQIKNQEIILEFYKRITIHIYRMYHIDLTMAELHKIVFPDALIASDGHIKIFTNEVALTIFNHISHFVSLEKLIN